MSVKIEKVNVFYTTQINEIHNYNVNNNRWFLDMKEETVDETMAVVNYYIKNNYPFLVVKNENKIIGYGYIERFSIDEIFKKSCVLNVVLGKDVTGLGMMKALLHELEVLGKLWGLSKGIIKVLEKDKDLINFYKNQGYNIAGKFTDVCYKKDRYLNLVVLEKDIS
ncbi:MAG: GNAT family N-acetyltransferase [Lachnospirales bacterium]